MGCSWRLNQIGVEYSGDDLTSGLELLVGDWLAAGFQESQPGFAYNPAGCQHLSEFGLTQRAKHMSINHVQPPAERFKWLIAAEEAVNSQSVYKRTDVVCRLGCVQVEPKGVSAMPHGSVSLNSCRRVALIVVSRLCVSTYKNRRQLVAIPAGPSLLLLRLPLGPPLRGKAPICQANETPGARTLQVSTVWRRR